MPVCNWHLLFLSMSKGFTSYKIGNQNALHYLTFATVNWIDVFTGKKYRDVLIDSLAYCRKEKGLELYGYVIMSNHVHLIARAKEGFELSNILRDFKKHTSKQIIKLIQEEPESRKEWLLQVMSEHGKNNDKNKTYQLWRNDNHPIELHSNEVIKQKLDYIHNNPVEAGIVEKQEDYLYSSARNYQELTSVLEIDTN